MGREMNQDGENRDQTKTTGIPHLAKALHFSVEHTGRLTALRNSAEHTRELASALKVGQSLFDQDCVLSVLKDDVKQALAGKPVASTIEIDDTLFHVWLTPVQQDTTVIGVSGGCVADKEVAMPLPAKLQLDYQLLSQYSTDIITKYRMDGICTYASPSIERILGYAPEEIVGQSVFDFFHPNDLKTKRRLFTRLLDGQADDPVCYRIRRKDGSYVWLETTSKPITGNLADPENEIITVSRDITRRKQTEERLLKLANFDSLTGLPNRALFRDRLRRAITRAQRNKTRLALLFLDLDRFKNINDSLGHHAGDQLLRGVAKRLTQNARKGDTVARLGGDEFTVILENIHTPDDASLVANKILELMEPPFRLDGHELVVSPSIGITLYPDDAEDMRSLLKNADTAMYRSKEQGGNRYQFYTEGMNARAYEHLILESNLRHALERDQFELYFQPQIDLHTHGIIGIEALIRWNHPERGFLAPDKFVPFAEETGLIIPIGEWALNNACLEAKRWQESGLPPVRIAVNLSMRQFRQKMFVDLVANALANSELDPHLLELEITESFLAQNVDQATKVLRQLHELGVQLSVDDFGTGYSSLSYLKRFPLNTLKIDQSFVKDLDSGPQGATIAEAIIALGKSLDLNIIAEGVETEEQVFFLKSRGCDRVQGYFVSPPLSRHEIVDWLKENRSRRILFEQEALWPDKADNS